MQADHGFQSADFAAELHAWVHGGEVAAQHTAVAHSFLQRFAEGRTSLHQLHLYQVSHYPLVKHFTKYLEYVLPQLPAECSEDWRLKSLIAENLHEEYGEAIAGHDHPALFVAAARSTGIAAWLGLPRTASAAEIAAAMLAHPGRVFAADEFIAQHDALCRTDWLAGLGAIGPGHEWAIPVMFTALVRGLERMGALHGFTPELRYYTTHIAIDQKHGAMLREVLLHNARDAAAQERIRKGAALSLNLRAQLWAAIEARWDAVAENGSAVAAASS